VFLVLALSCSGLLAAIAQVPESQSIGQKAQTGFQFGYSILGLLQLVALFLVHRWTTAIQVSWAASLAGAGGLAPVVWGEPSTLVGVIAAVCTLLIAWILIWLLRVGARGSAGAPDVRIA
jgi:hypothetical protein